MPDESIHANILNSELWLTLFALTARSRWTRSEGPRSRAAICVNINALNAATKKIVDCGKALWEILSEANEESDKS